MRSTLLLPILLLAGCVTLPAVSPAVAVRPETVPECVANCQVLGARLGAIVLIRNSAGCVCVPADPVPASPASATPPAAAPRAAVEPGASAIVGGAYIVALEEELQLQQQLHPTTPYRPYTPPFSTPGASGVSHH
jgi:hypothetical protein